MITQPTHEQTRRVTRSRTYAAPGFGPSSFECLGMGMGLGMQFSFGAQNSANPLTILGAAATKLWLRADLGVSGLGTAGATWADQSGNWGANFIQATVANQPAQALDGTIAQQAFTGDGVNDSWNSTGLFPIPGTNPYSIIVVAKIPSFAVGSLPLIGADSYSPGLATQASSKIGPQSGALGPQVTGSTAWKCITCELTNSTSDRIQQGAAQQSGATSGNGRGSNSYLFGIPTSSAWLAASIAEVIVVTPIPVSYTAIYAYLSGRYGASIHT